MCLTSMYIFLPRLLAELHSDSWYLRFCFKTILKLMRRMLVALLDTMKESPATVAAVDRFMRDEVGCSCIYNLHPSAFISIYYLYQALSVLDAMCRPRPGRRDTLVHGDCRAANIVTGHR